MGFNSGFKGLKTVISNILTFYKNMQVYGHYFYVKFSNYRLAKD